MHKKVLVNVCKTGQGCKRLNELMLSSTASALSFFIGSHVHHQLSKPAAYRVASRCDLSDSGKSPIMSYVNEAIIEKIGSISGFCCRCAVFWLEMHRLLRASASTPPFPKSNAISIIRGVDRKSSLAACQSA